MLTGKVVRSIVALCGWVDAVQGMKEWMNVRHFYHACVEVRSFSSSACFAHASRTTCIFIQRSVWSHRIARRVLHGYLSNTFAITI